jgi:hypothetical protein
MGPNRRAQERERAAARAAEEAKRAEAERKAITDAQKIVAIWYPARGGLVEGSRDESPFGVCGVC